MVVQVILLVASILILTWSVMATDYYAVPVVIAVAVLLQVVALMRHVESHVDALRRG
jgi:hypothetical protein